MGLSSSQARNSERTLRRQRSERREGVPGASLARLAGGGGGEAAVRQDSRDCEWVLAYETSAGRKYGREINNIRGRSRKEERASNYLMNLGRTSACGIHGAMVSKMRVSRELVGSRMFMGDGGLRLLCPMYVSLSVPCVCPTC